MTSNASARAACRVIFQSDGQADRRTDRRTDGRTRREPRLLWLRSPLGEEFDGLASLLHLTVTVTQRASGAQKGSAPTSVSSWWPQTCFPSSRLCCPRKTRRVFPYLAPFFSFLVADEAARPRPSDVSPPRQAFSAGTARGFPALISQPTAGASHPTARGGGLAATVQEPGPTPGLVASRDVLPLPLRLSSDVRPGSRGRREAGPPDPGPPAPPRSPRAEVDSPTCSPQPIIALLQTRFPTSASDWWSLRHMPALRRKGSWESEF